MKTIQDQNYRKIKQNEKDNTWTIQALVLKSKVLSIAKIMDKLSDTLSS